MMPARTDTARTRPEPAGEPPPTTIDPPPTPVEDLPAPEPAPEPGPTVRDAVAAGALGQGALLGAAGPDAPYNGPIPGVFDGPPPPVFGLAPEHTPDDEPRRDDYPLSAAEALAEVFRRVQPIAKGRQAEAKAGGYSFRGIDDVYAALHDLFAEVGLVVLPSTIDREREQRPRTSGSGYNYVTHVHIRLRFLAADGSSEELDGWGEGADTGDKSTGKAYSQAIKSALLAAFLIPTEASAADDPDRTNSEASRTFSPQEVERASRALAAGREATTFDALVNVRRRASELLAVPLTSDGVLAPLEVHLDGLRRALESRVPGEQS
jgi:hypothetical protein